MFAYCGNNPVNGVDYNGLFWSELWEYTKAAIVEIGRAIGAMSSAYVSCAGVAAVDGPLPLADVFSIVGTTLLTAGAIGYGFYQAAQAHSPSISNTDVKENVLVVPNSSDNSIVFPVNPHDFNPVGLIKVPRTGTKNGAFISWMNPITNTEVFRWDENPNFPNGPHYHIYGEGHYYPLDPVPEPYASIYFPFG